MKKLFTSLAALAALSVAALAAAPAIHLNVDAARLWTATVVCPGTNEVAFAAPAAGHAVVLEVQGPGTAAVSFRARGAAPVAVGSVTNGLLSVKSPAGVPPLHAGDALVLKGASASATNSYLVVYSAERSLDGSSR